MSEKPPTAATEKQSSFKQKHFEWMKSAKGVQTEAASGIMGLVGGLLGMSMIAALGILNPLALGIGGALAAIGGYRFTKNEIKKA